MSVVRNAIMYFLSFKAYVMLPIIIFIFAIVFGIKFKTAVKSSVTLGIGFLGIFIIFDYFAKIVNPVISAIVQKTGMNFNMVDLGWAPLAAITWSFKLAPLMILFIMIANVIMLLFKFTKTVDIDIWNYWQFIFVSALVYDSTKSILMSAASGLIVFLITLKLTDWCAPYLNKFIHTEGICTPTLSGVLYYPVGVIGNKILDKIPYLNKVDANPDKIKEKLGLLGEPSIIGILIGILLGVAARYDLNNITQLSVGIAAVIYILPKMSGIVAEGLIPISEGMKNFMQKRFPNMGQTYIGLDIAVALGQPAIVVTGILLIPVAILFSFILPGVRFIPVGDLTNIVTAVALVVIASKGNIVRSFILGIPIIILNLYIASGMGYYYTRLASHLNYQISGSTGMFTAFLDGGNILRTWVVKMFQGSGIALIGIPAVILIMYFTRKFSKVAE